MALDRRGVLAGGVAALLLARSAHASASAAELVASECALAAQDGKRVLLVFFAGWCTWCRQMDLMLADPAAAAILDAHFRIVHLRVLERSDEDRALQLPDADDVYARYAQPTEGLPFTAVLGADAAAVATSISTLNGKNFGFPVTDEELEGFEAMLAVAAPAMSAEERAALREACVRAMGPSPA